MQVDRRISIEVFNKDLVTRGRVAYESASFTDGWLRAGSGQFTVKMTEPILTELVVEGARVRISVLDGIDQPGEEVGRTYFFMSGYISEYVPGLSRHDVATFTVKSDWYMLDTPARVTTGNIKAESLTDYAQSVLPAGESAPAAGRVDNLSGYRPWSTFASGSASLFLGPLIDSEVTARVNARFPGRMTTSSAVLDGPDVSGILPLVRYGTVAEIVAQVGEAGDTGLVIGQTVANAARIGWDFFRPKTWAPVFRVSSGQVLGGTITVTAPTVTDVLVGGPGEAAARAMRLVTSMSRSTRLGRIHEVFRDATGAPSDWADSIAEVNRVAMYYHLQSANGSRRIAAFERALNDAALEVFVESDAKLSLSLQLAETRGFRWGGDGGFYTGDIITVAPDEDTALAALRFKQRIVSTTITQGDDGFIATPQLGDYSDDEQIRLRNQILRIAAAVNRQARSR